MAMKNGEIAYSAGGDIRRPGAKGLQTRRQIIEVTELLLGATRLRDLTVAQIAREAGVSTSTFYVYFKDVSDVVLAGLDTFSVATPRLMELLDEDWSAGEANRLAGALVEEYVRHWRAHRTLLRIRNLAAEEGDERFNLIRQNAVRPFLGRVAELVAARQKSGRFRKDLTPIGVAGALTALLERIAAVTAPLDPGAGQQAGGNGAVPPSDLHQATAHYLALTLGS